MLAWMEVEVPYRYVFTALNLRGVRVESLGGWEVRSPFNQNEAFCVWQVLRGPLFIGLGFLFSLWTSIVVSLWITLIIIHLSHVLMRWWSLHPWMKAFPWHDKVPWMLFRYWKTKNTGNWMYVYKHKWTDVVRSYLTTNTMHWITMLVQGGWLFFQSVEDLNFRHCRSSIHLHSRRV